MRILNLSPVANDGGGMRTLAFFDLELTPDVRLYGLRLLEAPGGNRVVYAAQAGSRRTATFSRSLAEAITKLISTELEAVTADVRKQIAA